MRFGFGKVLALLAAAFCLSNAAVAGAPVGAYASTQTSAVQNLVPGQTYTVDVSIGAQGASGLTFDQITLNPNLASQFQIVGGTCNTTSQFTAPTTCTVLVRFIGNQPGAATANLMMGCTAFTAAVGGYAINCNLGSGPGVVGTMARFAGTGVAAVVDALGREGLTLLAAALFALTAFVSLRRRA